ncbi:GNAT family N-acetyltransferase [Polycladidibacter hongkongensis]|uniref:GNAT family N-acetyltransferase n=1 Tax=Polycladidibacter hongkongensis TaxID=1647556 RepID=UPI00082A0DFA|nr:GNAT family N-acetyltransferase [Pseudovibrio hongkongensis]
MNNCSEFADGLLAEWRSFDELDKKQLYQLLKLRSDVFIVEQQCPFGDADGLDDQALHLLLQDGGEFVGTLRLMGPVAGAEGGVNKVQRVVVSKSHRRRGLAQKMLRAAIDQCARRSEGIPLELEAQVYAQALYASFGFVPIGDVFLDDGIEHILMRRV